MAMSRMNRRFAAAALAFAALIVPAAAASVLDGDTLDYDGVTVRLWGIEAPDKKQTCTDDWPAGQAAIDFLTKLIEGHKVLCTLKTTDKATPAFAVCTVDGRDLAAAMVSAGMAWANTNQAPDYTVSETNAMVNVVGVHAHRCDKAFEWRARHGGR